MNPQEPKTQDDSPTCEKCGHAQGDIGDHQDTVSRCAFWADGPCMDALCGDCFDASPCGLEGHEPGDMEA
jgi:hypothetical protein